MNENSNIFINKKILIYGLGKSGISAFNFLKKYNNISLFDDNKKIQIKKISNHIITSPNKIQKSKFDIIILSPGIDANMCKLKKFLKKNSKTIYTDLDVFHSFYRNQCITITGTNGKSTTCQLLYEVMKKQGFDVNLAGNIGYPILSIKNIKPRSIFVIEASSYQLDYSKLFNSKYAAIINISADHLERHKTLKNYISAKFKIIKNQKKNSIAFINKHDVYISKKIKKNYYKSKIVKVNTRLSDKLLSVYKNNYFLSSSNRENLSFVLEISKKFKIKKNILIDTIKKFKGLKYRQQIIFDNKNISIINDSKSTSYSSSLEMLKKSNNVYWLLGGIPKKGDKLNLPKVYYKNIKGFIFGKNFKKFSLDLKNKIKFKKFYNLKEALNGVFKDIKKDNSIKKTILFSPAAASFDSFINFEDRGSYFNKLIKRYINAR
ncbi:UDP-N-acetylmuramoyl-L-alanine--D-glutamate ligase [Candidatus Pelagibacter sp.]|nr:UDP-N-acetylmuramoyl-L-alanine--D-glutamate ligase [Candidatus Pelagibacter sp.]